MSAQKLDAIAGAIFRWPGMVIVRTGSLAAVSLLFLCLAQMADARADSAACLAKAASFVTELDVLMENERESNRPYFDLVERYFPLRDCEAEALLDIVRKSQFIRSIYHHSLTNEYLIQFGNDAATAWIAYYATEKKSSTAGAALRK